MRSVNIFVGALQGEFLTYIGPREGENDIDLPLDMAARSAPSVLQAHGTLQAQETMTLHRSIGQHRVPLRDGSRYPR